MDVYCSYTTETSHKNVISCGVSEHVHAFPKVCLCMFVCVPEAQKEEGSETKWRWASHTVCQYRENARVDHMPSGLYLFNSGRFWSFLINVSVWSAPCQNKCVVLCWLSLAVVTVWHILFCTCSALYSMLGDWVLHLWSKLICKV